MHYEISALKTDPDVLMQCVNERVFHIILCIALRQLIQMNRQTMHQNVQIKDMHHF